MFAVVLFSESNEVEVIPSCWLSVDEKVAYWPPYKRTEKAKAAVLTVEEPDETWGEYLVKVIKKYGTYEAARQHLPKAMRKNSLTSEDEGAKRVRMPSTKLKELSLLLQALTSRQPVQNTSQLSEEYKFPMTCDEDLTRVEELLDKSQKKALTAYLATLGGCNPGDVVRRMLRHIMDDEFAQQFNWLGRGEKEGFFSAFKITAVIMRVKKNLLPGASAVQKITASECEAVIKNWLKYSGDRSGGRKRRTGRQQGGDDTVSRDSSSSSSMDDDDF
ncbi:hypothetical protein AALO_G00222780 [Alosa alosa]|uniref:DUF4806 domain-containing protein n=1 Tax=Alosa alosa TaxID=278164 RepID=A0AAV6G241_9TELE|nr:hypothetical protein AALO_G00222780 [Alosa alosa]